MPRTLLRTCSAGRNRVIIEATPPGADTADLTHSHQHDPMSTPNNVIPIAVAALLVEGESARAIPGFTRYYATSHGRIISCYFEKPRVLRPWKTGNGYLQVGLVPDDREPGSRRVWKPSVHKCVILAFVGPPPVDPDDPHARWDCCHEDGDKENNALSNLRWDRHATNCRDNFRHGFRAGKRSGTGLTPVAVWTLRCRALLEPRADLLEEYSDSYGVEKSTVLSALRGKRSWDWIPFPENAPTAAKLAEKAGVTEAEAAELLTMADEGRMAA